jgi:hypothetical protein
MWTELASLTLNLISEQNSDLRGGDVSSCAINIPLKLWTLYSSDNFVSLESIFVTVSGAFVDCSHASLPVRAASEEKISCTMVSIKNCQSYLLLSFTEFSTTRIIHSEQGHYTVNDLGRSEQAGTKKSREHNALAFENLCPLQSEGSIR